MNNAVLKKPQNITEVSRRHFHDEGERIKLEDRAAIYEIRGPKDLAMQVDFGFARYDIILRLVDKYCRGGNYRHLDLGCGLGYIMAKMSERNYKTSGVDISRSFLDIAGEKLKYWKLPYEDLIEADLQKEIKISDSSFDVITSTDVLEHIERPELLLKQIHRLLKPSGRAVICTNNFLSIWGVEKFIKERILQRNCFHPIDRWWSYGELRATLKNNGFKVLEMRGTYFLPLVKLKKLLSLLGIYRGRYEINEILSRSPFKYFGRDIIFVLEKQSERPLRVRGAGFPVSILSAFFSSFRDTITKRRRHHTFKRVVNFLLVRTQLILRRTRVFGYPTFLVLEPANICNLKCPLCPTGEGIPGRAKGKMTFAGFKKIIDELGPYLYSVRLENWGEPLLNEEIFDMAGYARANKIAASFNTNLTFLNEEGAEKLVLSGLEHIKISLDGATAGTYLKYRVGGDFEKVLNNIRLLLKTRLRLKKNNPFIEVQFIVMKHNEEEVEKIKGLCSELGVDGLFLERLRADMRQELFNPDSQSIEKFGDWLPEDDKYTLFDYKARTRRQRKNICDYLWTTAVINWDGSIAPCCSIYDPKYDFGNIFSNGFRKIWNGAKYQAARELIGRRKVSGTEVACKFCFQKGVIA